MRPGMCMRAICLQRQHFVLIRISVADPEADPGPSYSPSLILQLLMENTAGKPRFVKGLLINLHRFMSSPATKTHPAKFQFPTLLGGPLPLISIRSVMKSLNNFTIESIFSPTCTKLDSRATFPPRDQARRNLLDLIDQVCAIQCLQPGRPACRITCMASDLVMQRHRPLNPCHCRCRRRSRRSPAPLTASR